MVADQKYSYKIEYLSAVNLFKRNGIWKSHSFIFLPYLEAWTPSCILEELFDLRRISTVHSSEKSQFVISLVSAFIAFDVAEKVPS